MRKYIIILISALLPSLVVAQSRVNFSGQIVAQSDSTPLIGATILVSGTTIGATTDGDGEFSIAAPKGSTFEISYIGYMSLETKLVPNNFTKISLEESSKEIDEVVVVGYGMVKRSESTVASSGLTSDNMTIDPNSSFEQALQGKMAGVMVTSTEGSPGGAMTVEIRGVSTLSGSSEPLYVIDGVAMDTGSSTEQFASNEEPSAVNPLALFNPNDIESVEVLKDASAAAIYGSRGANGVILITTKSGKQGKAKLSANFSSSYSTLTNKIEMLGAKDYATYMNWARNEGEYFSSELISTLDNNPTRWQDYIYRTAKTRDYSVNISGGQKAFTYMISGSYLDQEGIIVASSFSRATLRSNFTFNILPRLKVISQSNYMRGVYNSTQQSVNGDTKYSGVVKQALAMDPTKPLDYNGEDDDYYTADSDGYIRNPYIAATAPTRKTTDSRVLSNLALLANVTDKITFKPSISINYFISRADSYYPSYSEDGKPTNSTDSDAGLGGIGYSETQKWANENILTYKNTFNRDHNLTLTGVFSLENMIRKELKSSARGFLDDSLENQALQDALQESYSITSYCVETSLMSYVARANYSYRGLYMLTASMRADGSSKFGDNNKFGYFPSIAAAWNIDKESFVQNAFKQARINSMKLRLSWGMVGNQAIPAYQTQSTLVAGSYTSESGVISTTYPSRKYNPDLKWETTEQVNVGVDIGMFSNRLKVTANAYYKTTHDLLQSILVPLSTGFTSEYQNCGEIVNKGVELEVVGYPIKSKDFQWRVDANIGFNRNEITDLGGVTEQFTANLGTGSTMSYTPCIQKVGYSLGTFWGYQVEGIYQNLEECANIISSTPHNLSAGESESSRTDKLVGEYKIKDLDGNNIIDANDMTKIGDANPDFTFGITSNFSYKRLSLSVMFSGSIGGDIYNHLFSEIEALGGYQNLTQTAYDNRWQGEGTSNTYPKLRKATDKRLNYASSFFVEDGSYVKLKNLRLGFNFDKKLVKLPHFPSGTLYLTATNLCTWTKYRGYDPEVSSYGQNTAYRGIDLGTYPHSRTFAFGVSIKI